MTVKLIAHGTKKGKHYIIYYESFNFTRPYTLVRGKHIIGGKVLGTYKSMQNLLKSHPEFKRRKK